MLKTLVAALSLCAPLAALACDDAAPHASRDLSVPEAAKLLHDGQITMVDANAPQTRAKFGTVPGAVLLTGVQWDPNKELPKNKSTKLVFYCSNVRCTAAPSAAKRAAAAGYTDVAVMPEGIMGWVKDGQLTTKADGAPSRT